MHTCNPSTWEAEAEGSQIPGQHRLQSETLYEKQNQQRKEGGKEKK
jgi:hypothetical protein